MYTFLFMMLVYSPYECFSMATDIILSDSRSLVNRGGFFMRDLNLIKHLVPLRKLAQSLAQRGGGLEAKISL